MNLPIEKQTVLITGAGRGLGSEIAKSFHAPPDIDLNKYATKLKSRYQNPEICHLLKQIAMDGSQKLPQRIIHPLFENLSLGRPYSRLLTVVAAWIRYLQKQLAPENLAVDSTAVPVI